MSVLDGIQTRLQRTELGRFVRASLVQAVPRDHTQSDRAFMWRRIAAAFTLVVGATLLGLSLNLAPGDPKFYYTTAALALTWTIGSLASGPLHLGWANSRSGQRNTRPVIQPLALGALAVGVFSAGAVAVAQVPFLRDRVNDVLDHARPSSLVVVAIITFVNGIAEELFFRGALYAAIGRRLPVVISTTLYGLTTVTTGNLMLVFAAAILGIIVGLQRRVTGGILAPMITHVTWSLSMLFILPPLLSAVS